MSRTHVLDQFLDPLGAFLTPEVAQRLVDFRATPETQTRIDELAAKCNEGELTEDEEREYDTYISAIDFVSILQAKARSVLDQHAAN